MGRIPTTVGLTRGDGLVARFGSVVIFVTGESPSTERILGAAETAAGSSDPGVAIAQRLAATVFSSASAQPPAFGVVAPTVGGILVLLRGPVRAVVDGAEGTRQLSGERAMTWADEIVRDPVRRLTIGLDGTSTTEIPHTDLRSGVVSGGGFVVHAPKAGGAAQTRGSSAAIPAPPATSDNITRRAAFPTPTHTRFATPGTPSEAIPRTPGHPPEAAPRTPAQPSEPVPRTPATPSGPTPRTPGTPSGQTPRAPGPRSEPIATGPHAEVPKPAPDSAESPAGSPEAAATPPRVKGPVRPVDPTQLDGPTVSESEGPAAAPKNAPQKAQPLPEPDETTPNPRHGQQAGKPKLAKEPHPDDIPLGKPVPVELPDPDDQPPTAAFDAEAAAFEDVSGPRPPTPGRARPVEPPPPTATMASVLGALTSADGAVYPMDRPYVIGRDPMSDESVRRAVASPIVIPRDRHVSRVHAYVFAENSLVFIQDAGTPGGTFIAAPGAQDWVRVAQRPVELKPGWSIRIGERILTYRTDPPRR
ncbi:FHA domain-containing protein [Nocardia sp. NPDC051030]|uniref:FHA domain-containing protein n=1 Tax=Nocardia sp. NPDC051030 TaxID=3155162 RepID=UPI00342809A5